MKTKLLLFTLLLLAPILGENVFAHPPTGIVVDRQGTVFFSDLETVWKLDRNGKVSVFRAGQDGRHVHDLAIDQSGNIFGGDVSYNPATNGFVVAVWKISPTGEVKNLVGPTENPPRGAGIWSDSAGNTYFIDQNNHTKTQTLLLKQTPQGSVTTFAGGAYGHADGVGTAARFSSVGGMFVMPDGTIYLTDGNAVRKVTPEGRVSTLAKDLDSVTSEDDSRFLAGSLTGLAVDGEGNVYVADSGRRRLLKIDTQGRVSVVLRSEAPFFPNGVAVANGEVYVLEFGLTLPNISSGPRVRKISADGNTTVLALLGPNNHLSLGSESGVVVERTLATITPWLRYALLLLAFVFFIGGLAWRRRRRR